MVRPGWFQSALRRLALFALAATVSMGVACNDSTDGNGGERDAGGTVDSESDPTRPDAGTTEGESSDTGGEQGSDGGVEFDVPDWDTVDPGDGGLAPLELTSVSPPRGPVEGGTKFVIEGDGFTDETTVYFGSREADVELVDGRLAGETPEGTGPGTVPVKALDPESGQDSLESGFTYTTTLRVDSVSPVELPTDGGVEVTIEGRGFDSTTRASFDGATAARHNHVDSNTMRVVAPPGEAGPADLRLTNRDESILREEAVQYVEPLEVESVRPATGSTAGGTTVTVSGSGFESGMSVTFDGVEGVVQNVSGDGTEATVETPAHSAGIVDVGVQTGGNGALAEDAFYYRSSASEFTLAAVDPAIARESGKVDVTLIGSGLDASGLSASFGGSSATVGSTGPGHAVVTVPAHSPGVVDVAIDDGQGNTSTLADGFEYVADLWIDDVDPGEGDASGGTNVTLKGEGFSGVSKVEFGGAPAQFSVDSDTEISATAPQHSPGRVDVTVVRGEIDAELRDGFTYTEDLEVFGISPVRGAIAGNTYVEIRGRGFLDSKLTATFGGQSAKSIRILDTQTMAVRTPRHEPGAVDVVVERGSASAKSPEQFVYFDPTAAAGGAWGGAIRGSVNVTVVSQGGAAVEGAFVMLSTNPETLYKAETDQNGQVTLSGPDVYGEQTVTATAAGYSATTVQHVDAENITVVLAPPTSMGEGEQPPPPPTATFKGKVTGLNKLALEPEDDEVQKAMVFATNRSPWSNDPPPGGQNEVEGGDGEYVLTSRVGDLALVAVGGLENENTDEFTPLRLGVKRYQHAAEGKTYERDIELDIELDNTVRFKLDNPPFADDGPNLNNVVPYLDFGFEGVFSGIEVARGTSSIIESNRQPALEGKLSDVSFMAIGGSYTQDGFGVPAGELGYPMSVVIERDITDTSGPVPLTPLAIPEITTPGPDESPDNNLIAWDLNTSNHPEFYFVQILDPATTPPSPVWHAFAPGSETSVRLPDFPDFSHLPEGERPQPYPDPGQPYVLVVTGIRTQGTNYDNFSYSDLAIDNWKAYASDAHLIEF